MTCNFVHIFHVVIAHHGKGVAEIDETSVETNLVFAKLVNISPKAFVQRLEEVSNHIIVKPLLFLVRQTRRLIQKSGHLAFKKLLFLGFYGPR